MKAHGWFILPTQDISRVKKLPPCEVLCSGQGRCKDPDLTCHSILAGACGGQMQEQGTKSEKASSYSH